MTAIVRKRAAYCVEHWIDVVIVLLPVVGFLRILQLLRLGGVAYVGRMVRIYRVRGMAFRAFRALLLLDVVRRFLQINPEKRLSVLKERLEEQYDAIEETRREMRELETRLAADRAAEEPSKPCDAG
jgi:voltage-gated potassium channel